MLVFSGLFSCTLPVPVSDSKNGPNSTDSAVRNCKSPPRPCPVVVERRGPDAMALVRRRRGVAAAPGPADRPPGGHRRAVDRAAGPVAVTLFPFPFRDVHPTVLVLHVEPHRLPDAGLLHVRLQHAGFVDVGDANGDVEAAYAGAVPLLPDLYGYPVAVFLGSKSAGYSKFEDFRVNAENGATAEGEIVAIGARRVSRSIPLLSGSVAV